MKLRLAAALAALLTLGTAFAQTDWGQFSRYEKENEALRAQKNTGDRVVLLGNSITDNWRKMREQFFLETGYIGRGISGQTSYQFLVRFREDVLNLEPKVVVINAGTNDIAQNNHVYSLERTLGNIMSMCELARQHRIKVILTTVLPCAGFRWNPSIKDAPQKIMELNAALERYARKNGLGWIDYWTALADAEGGLKGEYTTDGCHPTVEGYQVMEPLLKQAVRKFVK